MNPRILPLLLAATLFGCTATAAGTVTPGASAAPGSSAAPSAAPSAAAGQSVEAITLKVDGADKTMPLTYSADPGSRGVTYTIGNQNASRTLDAYTIVMGLAANNTIAGLQNFHWYVQQGGAQVEQTYLLDGTPEVNTLTAAGGKATWTFKGKLKRSGMGNVGPASLTLEATVTGIPLQ